MVSEKENGKQLEELRGMSRMRFDYQTDPRADSMYKSRLPPPPHPLETLFVFREMRMQKVEVRLLRQERSTAEVMFAASANIDPLLKLYKCIMTD